MHSGSGWVVCSSTVKKERVLENLDLLPALHHNALWVLACRSAVEKKTVLENLDLVLLCMDEIVDEGWVQLLCLPCIPACLLVYMLFHCIPSNCSARPLETNCAWVGLAGFHGTLASS